MPHSYKNDCYQKRQRIRTGEDVEKRESLYTVGGNVHFITVMENSVPFPQKLKNRTTI